MISQMTLGPECEFSELFEEFVAVLMQGKVIAENEMARIFELTVQSKGKTINVCPGFPFFTGGR